MIEDIATPSQQTVQQLVSELNACKAELQECKANIASLAGELSRIRVAEAALLESQYSYLQLVKELPVGVILHGPKRYEIFLVNSKAIALLGRTKDQLLGVDPYDPEWDVIHEDGSPFAAKDFPVTQAVATGQSVHNVVMGVYRPQHTGRVWLLVNASLQLDRDGALDMVVATITDITQRKINDDKRLAQAIHIEELSHRLLQSQEKARRRFSSELHDRTSPNLAALRINLDIISKASSEAWATLAYSDRIEDTRALIEDTTISVRDICSELHPPLLDSGGLLGVLHTYVTQFAKRTGLRVNVQCPHGDIRLSHELELTMFRIVQEALTNSAKHAGASLALVTLQLDSDPMLLSIRDDGNGFHQNAFNGAKSNGKGGGGTDCSI